MDRPETPPVSAAGVEEMLERADVGIYAVDERGHIAWVSDRALELLGRTTEQMVGHSAHDLLHCDVGGQPIPRELCERSRKLSGPDALISQHAWFPHADGTLMAVQWFALPCPPRAPAVAALIVFQRAQTSRHGDERPASTARGLSEGERLALLADTTAQLIYNLDVHGSLRRVVALLLPRVADWAVIDLISEDGEVVRSVVVSAKDGVLRTHEDLQGPMPPIPATSPMPLARALRGVAAALTGPETYANPPGTGLAAEQAKHFKAAGIQTAAIAPIRGPHEILGALTLGRTSREEPFTPCDLAMVEDIARRIGIALENERRYQRQAQVTETMQRYLLPQLPALTGAQMTTRYLPASDASHVGGDWYDALTLPNQDTLLAIGDVAGHDLKAAAGMAQLRNLLRAYAWSHNQPPHHTVQLVDQAMGHVTDVRMATLILAQLEHEADGQWSLRWTNAGHPPPLLVDHDGQTRFLQEGSGILLGTASTRPRPDARITLPQGSTLVFYTDGLIESRRHSFDAGLKQLRRHAASLAHRPLESFTDTLLERARPRDNDDDVALLAIRIPLPHSVTVPGHANHRLLPGLPTGHRSHA